MRKGFIIAAALIGALPATPALAQGVTAAAGARQVSVEVREAGRVVASSSVRLQLGRPAAISLGGPYAMRLRVDADQGSGYTVRPSLTAQGPSGWTKLPSSPMTVSAGQPGTTIVERPSGPKLEIAVSVE